MHMPPRLIVYGPMIFIDCFYALVNKTPAESENLKVIRVHMPPRLIVYGPMIFIDCFYALVNKTPAESENLKVILLGRELDGRLCNM